MSSDVMKVGVDAPAWLVNLSQKDSSLDAVKQYRRLSRLAIVQGNTPEAQARIKEFGEGSVIMVPGSAKVAGAKEPFRIVPLFMYTEYIKWADRNDMNSERIQGRTFDASSEIAMKAKDRNRRKEPYGPAGADGKPKFMYTYVESLVFPSVIYGGEFHMTPVTLTFEKGEYVRGTNFCSAIMLRNIGGATAPLWTQVWEFRSGDGEDGHRNDQFAWWGFNFSTPSFSEEELEERGGAFILESEAPAFQSLHADLEEKYLENALEVDRSEGDEDVVINEPEGDSLD